MRAIWLWWLAALALFASATHAATYPPRPAGPVLDQANLIPAPQEAALDVRLRAYAQQTGRVLVVATVPSLQGETIEIYAVRLFEAWGIGGKESDQGLLLLVAPTERRVRIEVGYGLHGYITDALSGRIIRHEITPRFKQGDMAGGITAGVDALITQLNRTPADAKAVAEAAAAAEARESGSEGGTGSVIFWIVLIVLFMLVFGRGRRAHGLQRSGVDPAVVLWGASEAARHWSGGRGFGGGGFGGFGGGGSGGGGASGSW